MQSGHFHTLSFNVSSELRYPHNLPVLLLQIRLLSVFIYRLTQILALIIKTSIVGNNEKVDIW